MTTWDDVSADLIERLDQTLLRDPDFLRVRPGYGASAPSSDICVMRLIGMDEQLDGDIIRPEFLPNWRVAIRPRLTALPLDESSMSTIRTGEYLPLNHWASLTLSPMAVLPPSWVTLGPQQTFTVTLVRYLRTT